MWDEDGAICELVRGVTQVAPATNLGGQARLWSVVWAGEIMGTALLSKAWLLILPDHRCFAGKEEPREPLWLSRVKQNVSDGEVQGGSKDVDFQVKSKSWWWWLALVARKSTLLNTSEVLNQPSHGELTAGAPILC